jgi:hypothetical protein
MATRALTVLLACACVLGAAAPATAEMADAPWPPRTGPGQLYAHFGEEHYNDADGGTLLPKVVEQVARYKPVLVTTSGDKGDDGEVEQLEGWAKVVHHFDEAGVAYLAGAGNHDRKAPPGAPGGTVGLFFLTTPDTFDNYKAVFATRPYPMGDGAPYQAPAHPAFAPLVRPADDPAGAAATYAVDVGTTRWIFLDNSCWSLTGCDPFQARADGGTGSQLAFLREKAQQATDAGRTVFVVMHIPTKDPRDQSYTDLTARNHVMGKGVTTDNGEFESIAAATGVDAVFVGHIKGQFLYRGRGEVPYYIDGGAGGELYTTGPVGTDHGYWHGYRLMRVDGKRLTTDTVPIFIENGITIAGPDTVQRGQTGRFEAFGRQPVFNDPAKVQHLELRDPSPTAPGSGGLMGGWWASIIVYGGPLLLLGFFLLAVTRLRLLERRPKVAIGATAGFVVLSGFAAAAVAQREVPTATPRESLPVPARIWTSDNARVLAPAPMQDDDPRRDEATQTIGGGFIGRCPGTTRVSITSGWERTTKVVTVPSRGGSLVRSVRQTARVASRGRRVAVARVVPTQPVVVRVRVKRGKRVVSTLAHRCGLAPTVARWTPKRSAARGRYVVEVAVFSDRKPQMRRFTVRVR